MKEEARTDIGKFELSTFLTDGEGQIRQEYDLAGMPMEEAVGRLTVIVDDLRERIRDEQEGWEEISLELECPHCGELITSEHLDAEIGEGDDDEQG